MPTFTLAQADTVPASADIGDNFTNVPSSSLSAIGVIGPANAGDAFGISEIYQTPDVRMVLVFYDSSFNVLSSTPLPALANPGATITAPANTAWWAIPPFCVPYAKAGAFFNYDLEMTVNGVLFEMAITPTTPPDGNVASSLEGLVAQFPLGYASAGGTVIAGVDVNEIDDGLWITYYDSAFNVLLNASMIGPSPGAPPYAITVPPSTLPSFTAPAGAYYWTVQTVSATLGAYHMTYTISAASAGGGNSNLIAMGHKLIRTPGGGAGPCGGGSPVNTIV